IPEDGEPAVSNAGASSGVESRDGFACGGENETERRTSGAYAACERVCTDRVLNLGIRKQKGRESYAPGLLLCRKYSLFGDGDWQGCARGDVACRGRPGDDDRIGSRRRAARAGGATSARAKSES